MLKLGYKARDTITGFEGIVVARLEWLGGHTQIGLDGELVEGKPIPTQFFEECRIELVPQQAVLTRGRTNGDAPAGPMAHERMPVLAGR